MAWQVLAVATAAWFAVAVGAWVLCRAAGIFGRTDAKHLGAGEERGRGEERAHAQRAA